MATFGKREAAPPTFASAETAPHVVWSWQMEIRPLVYVPWLMFVFVMAMVVTNYVVGGR